MFLFDTQVLAEGSMTVDEIHEVSKIDHWFLRRLERIANHSKEMEVFLFLTCLTYILRST